MRADGRLGVVTLVDRLVHGGAERLAAQIATRLDKRRFESTLCVTRWTDPGHVASGELPQRLRADAEAAGVRFLGLDRSGARDLAAWAPLIRLLRSGDVQVVHGHMHGSNTWAVILGRLARVPVIVAHEHSWAFSGRPGRSFVDRHVVATGSHAMVAVSESDRRRMVTLVGIPPRLIRLIPNAIEGRAPTPGRDVRAELGIAAGAPVIGSVGALRAEKRFDVLLSAAALLRSRSPGVRVLIAGEGVERPRLESRAAELGLGETLLMLGARTDVPDLLEAIDVAVTSSDSEGSPLSVMEYMEAGRPVVATDVGGVSQIVEDGVHGLLVPRRDPQALAEAMATLLADPERRLAMGAAGRARRRAEFDFDVMVGRIEGLYEQLYAARRGGRAVAAS